MAQGGGRFSEESGIFGKASLVIRKEKKTFPQKIRRGAFVGGKKVFFKIRRQKIGFSKAAGAKEEPPKDKQSFCAKGKKETAAKRPLKKVFFGLIGNGKIPPNLFCLSFPQPLSSGLRCRSFCGRLHPMLEI